MGFDSYGMSPWMWILGSLMMIIVIGALILLVVWAVRTVGGAHPVSSNTALEVLRRRLAAGEITQDEFEKTRRLLEG
ncbi:MAG TPA: SHOCT domain-containing protein [Candidatus Dormibacteraeota bacterium]|nr:SHOCT domain-containing protein [Candidatus Dormibacteraeota bacterium]